MSYEVVVVCGLHSSLAAMVEVIVREILLDHSHDTFPVRDEFGFCEDNNVVVVSSDMIIDNFP